MTIPVHRRTPPAGESEASLVRLLCTPDAHRDARRREAQALAQVSSAGTLLGILTRLNLVALAGTRLLDSGIDVPEFFTAAVIAERDAQRRRGEALELVVLGLLAALEAAGIRALPLKGVVLARRLYEDVGLRPTSDIDILVGLGDLSEAAAVASAFGWRLETRRTGGVPLLHETLVHPELPELELHWRVHWYESQFAGDALERSEREHAHLPWCMRPVDELAALLLFYQRDGFSGLRIAADVATWHHRHPSLTSGQEGLEELARSYPRLEVALRTAAATITRELGIDLPLAGPRSLRATLASELGNPFLSGADAQIRANVGLIDLLLAPRGELASSVMRELDHAPNANANSRYALLCFRASHAARVAPRWVIALMSAISQLGRGALRRGLPRYKS